MYPLPVHSGFLRTQVGIWSGSLKNKVGIVACRVSSGFLHRYYKSSYKNPPRSFFSIQTKQED